MGHASEHAVVTMQVSAGKVFQLQHTVGATRPVFETWASEHDSLATMRLHFAHEFDGVADILDRVKLDWRHDCIAGYMTHAGNPASSLTGGVERHQLDGIGKPAITHGINRSLPIAIPCKYFAIERHASGKGITPMIREGHLDSAASPKVGAVPISPYTVELFTGKPTVNGLAVPMESMLHLLFVHCVTSLGCLAFIGLQDSSEVNSIRGIMAGFFWRLGRVMNTRGSLSGGGIRVVPAQ